jgi:Beta-propeller repeat
MATHIGNDPLLKAMNAQHTGSTASFYPMLAIHLMTSALLVPLAVNAQTERAWATYDGGTGNEPQGTACAVDTEGNVYLGGTTSSLAGIASSGYQMSYAGGPLDAFLAKFDGSGTRLWSTYYGGPDLDAVTSVTVDGTDVYIAGQTVSDSGIAVNGHQDTFGGTMDLFLAKFNGAGELQWATYYGGTGQEQYAKCTVDPDGNVYVSGTTQSPNTLAIAEGGYQTTYGGGLYDAFLVKFSPTGQRLWGTYYGGTGSDIGLCCTTDHAGNVYLSGQTFSTTGIAHAGHDTIAGPSSDAFLVKFNADGVRLWGTYYAGAQGGGIGHACAADANGNVYLAGQTQTSTEVAYMGHQNTYGGAADAYLVKFNGSGERQWATYYGGAFSDWTTMLAVNDSGQVLMAGITYSETAIAEGGHQDTLGGNDDAFLVKFDPSGARLWGTYYGGPESDRAWCVATDPGTQAVYVAGHTASLVAIADGGHQNTYGGGSSDAFLVKFDDAIATGISPAPGDPELRSPTLTVYPSPCDGLLNVGGALVGARSILFDNSLGERVLTSAFAASIDITPLAQGTYTVTVLDGQGSVLARSRMVRR